MTLADEGRNSELKIHEIKWMDEFYVKVEFFMHASSFPPEEGKSGIQPQGIDGMNFVILICYRMDVFAAQALNMLAPILLLSGHQPIRGVIP